MMTRNLLIWTFVVLGLLSFGVYHREYFIHNSKWYLQQELHGKDLVKIRDAGRVFLLAISKQNITYPNRITAVLNRVDIPEEIKELKPEYIDVGQSDLLIKLPVPRRCMLMIFATNAPQYATEKLIDGLWFWNGNSDIPPSSSSSSSSGKNDTDRKPNDPTPKK